MWQNKIRTNKDMDKKMISLLIMKSTIAYPLIPKINFFSLRFSAPD